MTARVRSFLAVATAIGLAGCWSNPYEYPSTAQYVHRSQSITMNAGSAQEANEATQVIDPWKRGVGNPRYPVSGDRMVNAAERYRAKASTVSQPGSSSGQTGQPGASPTGGTSSSPSSSSGTAGTP